MNSRAESEESPVCQHLRTGPGVRFEFCTELNGEFEIFKKQHPAGRCFLCEKTDERIQRKGQKQKKAAALHDFGKYWSLRRHNGIYIFSISVGREICAENLQNPR